VIDGLDRRGHARDRRAAAAPPPKSPIPISCSPNSRGSKAPAVRRCGAVANGGYSVTLLDGVTGSGKTEVYFEAVADMIRRRQSADPDAGDRADRQFLDRFARAVRRAAGWNGIPN
jgi:primosomal protein N' (replication factor Y)